MKTLITTTITPNFQVHIPVSVRQQLGLTKHGPARIKAEGKKIIIEPIKSSFLNLGGKYQSKRLIPAEKIRSKIVYR
ncbi:AbrB/MazE/SpoVT family DNA-binding domain-containing protein [Patescibacteria group bacterium]